MGAGILPVALHDGQIYFLFGREVYDNCYGDFGGRADKNETVLQTAIREGYEELNGALGTKEELHDLVQKNLVAKLIFNREYTVYVFLIPFNPGIPELFNNNHAFIKKHFPDIINKNGFFEKDQLRWFTKDEIMREKDIFRRYHKRFIIDRLIGKYNFLFKKINKVKKSLI